MQRQIAGPDGKGKSALYAKLLVDSMQVKLDGSFGDVEFARNQFVGLSLIHICFVRAQPILRLCIIQAPVEQVVLPDAVDAQIIPRIALALSLIHI